MKHLLLISRSAGFLAGCCAFLILLTAGQANGAPKPRLVYIAIVSVDPTAMTITVEPRNSMFTDAKTYNVTAETKITLSGNPATVADLKPGLQVHLTLDADGAAAQEISASPPPRGSE